MSRARPEASVPFPAAPYETVSVAGIRVTSCRIDDVEAILSDAIGGGGEPLRLATVNLNFLRLSRNDRELREALLASSHNFADGWPVLLLASLSGGRLPGRVTGSDLTPRICEWASRHGWRLGLVGASDRTREVLSRLLPERYGPVLAGHWTPDYRGRPLRDPELCEELRQSGAQILLVALGCPRQELWIRDNLARSGARAAIGVGGSLDFMAGVQHRAPPAFQTVGMEWLYRMARDPQRLAGRYARDFVCFERLVVEAAAARLGLGKRAPEA